MRIAIGQTLPDATHLDRSAIVLGVNLDAILKFSLICSNRADHTHNWLKIEQCPSEAHRGRSLNDRLDPTASIGFSLMLMTVAFTFNINDLHNTQK